MKVRRLGGCDEMLLLTWCLVADGKSSGVEYWSLCHCASDARRHVC